MVKLIFTPLLGSGWLALVLLLLPVAVLFLFPLRRQSVSPVRRRVLLGLRLLICFFFAILLFRPVAVFEQNRPLPATLLVIADTSESMSVQDQAGKASRYDEMARMLTQASDAFARFEKTGSVEAFRFDSDTAPIAVTNGRFDLPPEPTGRLTSLGESLAAILARSAGKRILGAILLSDGAQQSRPPLDRLPQDAAFLYRDASIPIWTLCCGTGGNLDARRDVAIRELVAPDRVFAENTMTVSGFVRAVGAKGQTVRLALNMESESGEMETVAEREMAIESDEAAIEYKFVYAPKTPGQWKLTVEAQALDGELLTRNNRLSDFVEVVDGGFAVLCLEGTPRFEQKFIRMALESSAEIRTDYGRTAPDRTVLLEGKSEAERIAAAAAIRKSLVEPFFAPGRYAAYILGDIDSSAFQPEELSALADRVREGAGLILAAGDRTFSAGGYATTPLADLFPVQLDPKQRIPLDMSRAEFEKGTSFRTRLTDPVQMIPIESQSAHFLTQLSVDPAKSIDLWQNLPPLAAIWRCGELKPGAESLAVSSGSDPIPLLITQLYGSGRVALLATDSTWRWSLGGFGEQQQRFWRQLVLWTANRDQLREGELAIVMDKRRFNESDPVEFRVLYRPKESERGDDFTLAVETLTPDGRTIPDTMTAESSNVSSNESSAESPAGDAAWLGVFRFTGAEGDYRIAATVRSKQTGEISAETSGRFLVESFSPELENPAASPATLAAVAHISGGDTVLREDLSDLIDTLSLKKEKLVETRSIQRSLYDTWPVFGAMLLLLFAEWFLRRRWGMV